MKTFEKRFAVRHDGHSRLSGVAAVYAADIADTGPYYERYAPGCFGNVADKDIVLLRQHKREVPLARSGAGLELIDSPTELSFRADLVNTSETSDVLELVRSGIMRGCSLGFHALEERVLDGHDKPLVEILKAEIVELSIVDSGAYKQATVEARAAHIRTLANKPARKPALARPFRRLVI